VAHPAGSLGRRAEDRYVPGYSFPPLDEFGRRVREARRKLRLSQEELGERAGLHRTYIGHVERGEVNPSFKNVLLIAQALGVDPGDLISGLRI
jgi:transcriptional regulator with XRE-family HTH domain